MVSLPLTPNEKLQALQGRQCRPALRYYYPWVASAIENGAEEGVVEEIHTPGPGDWLVEHPTPLQSFETFRGVSEELVRRGGPRRIILVPLGKPFLEGTLDTLQRYLAAFYGVEVEVHPPINPVPKSVRRRTGEVGTQLRTTDIHTIMQGILRPRGGPAKAIAVCAVTKHDLYPKDSWNFVFGQALISAGVGVFSFCRYTPQFNGEPATGDPSRDEPRDRLMHRACKVMSHEVGHMFGLKHCVSFNCLMNGSNHIAELDYNSIVLCPMCTYKLLDRFQWNLLERMENLVSVVKGIDCFRPSEVAMLKAGLESLRRYHEERPASPGPSVVNRRRSAVPLI